MTTHSTAIWRARLGHSDWTGNRGHRTLWTGVFVALMSVSLASLALSVSSAMASRDYDSQMAGVEGGFRRVASVAIDDADNVWVVDDQLGEGASLFQRGLYKFSPYPSQTLLEAPTTTFGTVSREFHMSVADATNEVYVSQTNGRRVFIFKNGLYSREWANINGSGGGVGIDVAADNSSTYSRGRIYLSLTDPENFVEVLDPEQRPITLPATASYIEGNRITGSPNGSFSEVEQVEVDRSGNIYISDQGAGVVYEYDSSGTYLRKFLASGSIAIDPTNSNVLIGSQEFDAFGNAVGNRPTSPEGNRYESSDPAFNSEGYLYLPAVVPESSSSGPIEIFKPEPAPPRVDYGPVSSPTTTTGTLNASIDPNGGGSVTSCQFEYGTTAAYGVGTVSCSPASPFSAPTQVSAGISGLTTENSYHYRVVVTNSNSTKLGADQVYTPHRVVGLTSEPATSIAERGATLNATLLGDGTATQYYFEWGATASYGNATAAPPGLSAGSPSGPVPTALSSHLDGLDPLSTYHFRVVASNTSGTSYGEDQRFTTPPGVPSVSNESVSDVHADRAVLHAQVNPNGAGTDYQFEYVDDSQYQSSGFANATSVGPEVDIGQSKTVQTAGPRLISGLAPGTIYHYRAVGLNSAGSGTSGGDHTFRTFPFIPEISDTCPNSHVRQQTGAALLLDCRAYELVSAGDTGGYDVESTLVPGQTPFGGYPQAQNPGRVLYGINDGALPGPWNPTNRGVDPYVATRGDRGWSTEYVGIPGNNPNADGPFSSTVAEADPGLRRLAFDGPQICRPCFSDGSTGIPIRMPDGNLVQGMSGSVPQPAAEPVGHIGKHFSADGSHFIFGSTSAFEADGNSNGDISIYDRDLSTGQTNVVSKTPNGATMTGPGIGELDISANGSRILIGRIISETEGVNHWHLYMNVDDSSQSIDLTPGATSGVLYNGMTSDGARVFFTAADPFNGGDTDGSADLYRADVSESTASLTRVSTGLTGSGDSDSCNPVSNTKYLHWNTVEAESNCDVLAVGGGGGVASGDGTIYFLSPELLNGNSTGVPDAPNLYMSHPDSDPQFVATLESGLTGPTPFLTGHVLRQTFGSFSGGQYIAVDNSGGPSDGYTYVADTQSDLVFKFDQSGLLVSSWGTGGRIAGAPTQERFGPLTGIAVDNAGTLYVVDEGVPGPFGVVDPSRVFEFNQDSSFIKHLNVRSLSVERHSGIAVDNSGNIYTNAGGLGGVFKYDAAGNPLGNVNRYFPFIGFTVDPISGDVYIDKASGGIHHFEFNGAGEVKEPGGKTCPLSVSGCRPTNTIGGDIKDITALAVDPLNHNVYADRGNEIVQFDALGQRVGTPSGTDVLDASNSIAVNVDHEILALTEGGSKVARFGPPEVLTDFSVDNPLVIDSLKQPESRETGDFQVSPEGGYAAFTSALPLTGYDNASHREVFRFDAFADSLECASCNSTREQATEDATLPSNGLGLSDDGRVFFNSSEGLVDRDLNRRADVYEWEPDGVGSCETDGGCVELISTGASPFASGLLGVSANGTDVHFFTRDRLVAQDNNGNSVKIYDARAFGGFPFVPAVVPCKASDECHGPGSAVPPAPDIKSIAGTPEVNTAKKRCQRGLVRRRGRCVRPHKGKGHRRHSAKGKAHG